MMYQYTWKQLQPKDMTLTWFERTGMAFVLCALLISFLGN